MFRKLKEMYLQRTPLEMITKELAIAHLAKLDAETAVEYAQSIVDYNIARINRLNQYLSIYPQEKSK